MKKTVKLPSEIIREVISTTDKSLTIKSLADAFGSQGFGFMFIVMALPATIPLPPGLSLIPAVFLLLWSLQRALGKINLWLPNWLGRQVISPQLAEAIVSKALPLCEKLESLYAGRKNNVLKEREIRLGSIIVAAMSLLIALPTPFLNTIPALITILIGLAVLSGNRGLLWINMGLGLLATFFIGSTMYLGIEIILDEIVDLMNGMTKLL